MREWSSCMQIDYPRVQFDMLVFAEKICKKPAPDYVEFYMIKLFRRHLCAKLLTNQKAPA